MKIIAFDYLASNKKPALNLDNGLATTRKQAIILTIQGLVY